MATKSKQVWGLVTATGSSCQPGMPWETGYADIFCDDNQTRRWWCDHAIASKLTANKTTIKGFVRQSTGNLFKVQIVRA